jgi:hypothetical protein
VVIKGLPQRGQPALNLLLNSAFSLADDEADLPRRQSAGVSEQHRLPLISRESGDEIEDLDPLLVEAICLDGDVPEMGIGARQVKRWPVATVGIDGGIACDPQQPGVHATITTTELPKAHERPLERSCREVQGIRVVLGPGAKVSVHRQAVLLVELAKGGRIQTLGLHLDGRA